MLDVTVIGTGAMKPLPERRQASLYISCLGSSILIDCGEGTQTGIVGEKLRMKPIDIICITHFHADHIAGLPGFLLTLGNANREKPVTIIGPEGIENIVNSLRVIAPELPYELKFIELTEPCQTVKAGPYTIEGFRVDHVIECYSYKISVERRGRFSAEKAAEYGAPRAIWSRLQDGETVTCICDGREKTFTPEMVMGPARKGISVVYSTDTRPLKITGDKAEGSDLFICEGTYGDEGDLKKAVKYHHMTFREAAELGVYAGAKRMWLTHFSPSMLNPAEYSHNAEKILPGIEMAYDGRKISLNFEEE